MRLGKVGLPWKPFPCLPQPQKTAPVSKLHWNVIITSPFSIMNTAVDFSRVQGMFSCLPLEKILHRKTFWNRNIKKAITEFGCKTSFFITEGVQLIGFLKKIIRSKKSRKWYALSTPQELLCLTLYCFNLIPINNVHVNIKHIQQQKTKKSWKKKFIFISRLLPQNGSILSEVAIFQKNPTLKTDRTYLCSSSFFSKAELFPVYIS